MPISFSNWLYGALNTMELTMFNYDLLKDVEPTTHITLTRFKDKISGVAKVSYGVGADVYSVSTIFQYTVDDMDSFTWRNERVVAGTDIEVSEEDYANYWIPDFTVLGV